MSEHCLPNHILSQLDKALLHASLFIYIFIDGFFCLPNYNNGIKIHKDQKFNKASLCIPDICQ